MNERMKTYEYKDWYWCDEKRICSSVANMNEEQLRFALCETMEVLEKLLESTQVTTDILKDWFKV